MFKRLFSKKKVAQPKTPEQPPAEPPAEPRLAHDERSVIYVTGAALALARTLLEDARERYACTAPDDETIEIEVPPGYEHIHDMELHLALLEIDTEYGFQAVSCWVNTHYLRKIA